MFKIADVMTRNIISVTKDTPVYDAMRLLVEHNITGMPVVSEDNTLLGVLSEKDMLRLLYEQSGKQGVVENYMTGDPVTFDIDDNLVDVCECLIQSSFRRIPILADGKLAGIVSRRDIIKYILELRRATK